MDAHDWITLGYACGVAALAVTVLIFQRHARSHPTRHGRDH